MKVVTSLGLLAISVVCSFASDSGALRKAPELAFTIPGQGQRLLSQYRGKVIALEFILTTCPHCQAASKEMTKFQQEYGARGFQALDLAINAKDEGRTDAQANEVVADFARNFEVGFPVGWIPRDQMMNFMGFSMADRMVVPQLVLIDRKGYVHYQTPASDSDGTWEKLMNTETIRQHIGELLSLGSTGAGTHTHRTAATASARKPQ